MTPPRLRIVPAELKRANAYVQLHHRHHPPVIAHRFSLAVIDGDDLVRGVAIVGQPKARMAMDGFTVEVNRVATDGCPNACSALYGAAWRAARQLGYRRIITYTLSTETGVSLHAAGWDCDGHAGGGSWDTPGRPPVRDLHPLEEKVRWSRRSEFPETGYDYPSPIWPADPEDHQAVLFP